LGGANLCLIKRDPHAEHFDPNTTNGPTRKEQYRILSASLEARPQCEHNYRIKVEGSKPIPKTKMHLSATSKRDFP
jgi:hypothetical protein